MKPLDKTTIAVEATRSQTRELMGFSLSIATDELSSRLAMEAPEIKRAMRVFDSFRGQILGAAIVAVRAILPAEAE
jgi:hypothetical protein